MRAHGTVRKNLYGFLRDELSAKERRATENHLKSCAKCTRELQLIREAMDLITQRVRKPNEHRGELYWQQFAEKVDRRIQEDLSEVEASSFMGRLLDLFVDNRKPISFGFVSALFLMVLAFGVWSLWIKSPLSEQATLTTSVRKTEGLSAKTERTALELRAENYLEQSKILLIGIMNTDAKSLVESKPFLDRQREMSRVLVHESQEISSGLTDPSQQRLKELISDLGLILIQIANIESMHGIESVEIVKGGVERNGILFKLNLEEIQRATESSRNKDMGKQAKPTI